MTGASPAGSRLPEMLRSLAEGPDRAARGRELATFLQAEDVLLLVRDREIGIFLPITGFPQTLAGGLKWRDFIGECVHRGEHRDVLPWPNDEKRVAAFGRLASSTCLLIVLGGEPDAALIADACSLLALMAFGFEREGETLNQEVQARIAHETAAQAKMLTDKLDTIRRELDRHLEFTKAITDSLGQGVVATDEAGRITFVNPMGEQILGWSAAELVGKEVGQSLHAKRPDGEPWGDDELYPLLEARTEARLIHADTDHFTAKDGTVFPVGYTAAPIQASGKTRGTVVIFKDLTQQRRMEQHMRDAQKLESIGLLAGGIAHDFNNLLTGILGHASLALTEFTLPPDLRELIDGIMTAGERAADLTRQLLAYAGKGQFQVTLIDVSELASETVRLAKATISKSVDIIPQLGSQLPRIQTDRTQLQQLLMNLLINGAEAIGDDKAGTVWLKTRVERVDEEYVRKAELTTALKPGLYVCIEVIDTGAGMDAVTKARIFDPFFTTKFFGRGLGLAAAAGIVRSHHGAMEVFSELGHGSTFRVLFPAQRNAGDSEKREMVRILVVDDEEIVRHTLQATLQRFGYEVDLAMNGLDAVERLRQSPKGFDLVILDNVMPVMSGDEAIREIRKLRLQIPVLLTSGYAQEEALRRFGNWRPTGFLQKPFRADQVLAQVRACLGASAESPRSG